MADFLSLITAVPTLMSAFGGGGNKYRKQQEELAARQAAYAEAMTNPNSDLYKSTYSGYQNANRQNLAQALAELQGQNRMNSALGRTPLLGGERGGEALFRQLMQGYQTADAQANDQTMNALRQGAGMAEQARGAYANMTPAAAAQNRNRLYGYNMIENMLRPSLSSKDAEDQQAGGIEDVLKRVALMKQQGYSY